jgi:hypothetical protein
MIRRSTTVTDIPQQPRDEEYWRTKYEGEKISQSTVDQICYDVQMLDAQDRYEGVVNAERDHFRWILRQMLAQCYKGLNMVVK